MSTIVKRNPFLAVNEGVLGISDDPADQREGELMLAEHHLLGFAACMSSFDCEGFLYNGAEVKQKLQDLYDQFMKEFDVYLKVTDSEGRFKLVPKPDELKYTDNNASEQQKEVFSGAVNQEAA